MIFDVCYSPGTMSNFARLTLFWAPDTDPLPMNIYTEGIYSSTGDKGMSLKLNHIYWYVLLKNEGRKPIRDYIYLAVTPLHGIYGHGTTAASSGSISLDAWLPLLCQLLFWKRKHILGKTEVVKNISYKRKRTIWAQDRFRGRSSPFQETGWQKIGTGPERKIQSCINRISWWEPYLEQWGTSGNI